MSSLKFCPTCNNYLYLNTDPNRLTRLCRNCGYQEEEEKGGLIVETLVQERSSEGYKILLNEFTRQDPTLPHVKSIKCPKQTCPSNGGGAERDVIYIKYDTVNLKYIYICNACGETWRSRS
jgi:DNA-directed RNA polymerase subunit M/transcription elongation factor TFIIS